MNSADLKKRTKKFAIEVDDFDYSPFAQAGGIGKLQMIFGKDYARMLDELSEAFAA